MVYSIFKRDVLEREITFMKYKNYNLKCTMNITISLGLTVPMLISESVWIDMPLLASIADCYMYVFKLNSR